MAIDYESVLALEADEQTFTYGDRETMLYALGIGMGANPMNKDELPFIFEKNLKAVPTMATVVAWGQRLLEDIGINLVMVVHGEQRITLHQPLPGAATVVAQSRVKEIVDKGEGKGALLYVEQVIRDQASGELLCTNLSTVFARGDGGCGGPSKGGPAPHVLPDRDADFTCDLPTRPDQALIYRLSGDRNPLHADPEFAAMAGFERPILHGLCTYGIACRALLQTVLDYDPAAIAAFEARFSSPVFPGETLRTEIWRDGKTLSFRCSSVEKGAVVLNNGKATLR
jgi:acyl dehydratase